jgi:signal transduction histidine kinase
MQILMGPHLRNLEAGGWEDEEALAALDAHFKNPAVLNDVPVIKVWRLDGTIVYSNNPELIGRNFEVADDLTRAMAGEVVSEISELTDEENLYERELASQLIEIYVPVRRNRDGEVYAVAEFYISVDSLVATIDTARTQTWGVVGGLAVMAYILLLGMMRQAGRTMRYQRDELRGYSQRLQTLLQENQRMNDKVVTAGANAMAVSERYLQRLSADLHDGAGQDLALVLLRLGEFRDRCGSCLVPKETADEVVPANEFDTMTVALRSALRDVRSLSKELRLSAIDTASVGETIHRAVRDYRRKTGRRVDVMLEGDDVDAPQPIKITLYRVVQEALMNGFLHAGEADQKVSFEVAEAQVTLRVSDNGNGFSVADALASGGRLGLMGMRDRVELLGGDFSCFSAWDEGATVTATLPLNLPDFDHE